MTYTIQQFGSERIIIVTFEAGFSIANDMPAVARDLRAAIDQAGDGLVLIFDLESLHFDLDDLIKLANQARDKDISPHHDPRVLQTIAVSSSKVVQLSAKGLSSATFGNLTAVVMPTIEEAINYARSRIASSAA